MNKKFFSSIAAAVSTAAMAGYTAMTAFAEDAQAASSTNQEVSAGGSIMSMVLPLGIMFVLLYFIAIRPQKKRDRELKEMQESLQVGDEVVTGGGIVGIVVSVGEDTVVIETGGAKFKLRIKNWAITENVTAAERIKEAKVNAAKKSGSGLEAAAVADDSSESKKAKKKKADEEE